MKIWKRIALCLLALTILASFAACQVTKAPASTEDDDPSTKPPKTTVKTSKTTESTPAATASQTTTTAATTPEPMTEPATEPIEIPGGETGDSHTTGAAIGEMLQSRLENIPEIDLDALYENSIIESHVGMTTELLLEGSLAIAGAEGIFAEMLADFSSYITVESQADTQYFSLEQDFPSIENSKFFIEALEMDDELYLSMPDYFGHIVSLPLSEMIPPEYEDLDANAQLVEEMMAELTQSTSEVANTFIALLGDSLNAMFAAMPDDRTELGDVELNYAATTITATKVGIDLRPEDQPLVVAALLEAIPQSQAFLPFCEAFLALAEAAENESPYRSAQEFADDLTVEIADLVEDLREVEYTEGPNINLELIFDDMRIYDLEVALYSNTGEVVHFYYYNTLTEADGRFEISVDVYDNTANYVWLNIYSNFTDTNELRCSIDLELSEYVADEAIDLSFSTYTYNDDDGNPCFDIYSELLFGEDNAFVIDCYTWTETDGEDVYYYAQIPELTVAIDGELVIDGELYLTTLTYENKEVYTYTVDDAIPLEELANSEELLTELAEGLCQNPILAILVEGMY